MMLPYKSVFIVISSALALTSPFFYIQSILKGVTKPHRTTRFVVLLITVLSTVSLYASHDRVAFWLSLVSMLQAIPIFFLSLRYGMGGWARTDIACLVIALIGIVLWRTTSNPILGLYSAIIADFVGYIPAIIKTWRFPHTESWIFFSFDTVAGIFSTLAVATWTSSQYAYPLYIFAINFLMVLLIVVPRKQESKLQ